MRYQTLLFDLDGTLTDSGEGIMNCAILALEHFQLPIPTREEMRVFIGPPLHETFIKFGIPEDKVDEAVAIFRSRYIPIGKFENKPYPGIRELLAQLKQEGFRLLVATSKPEVTAMEVLDKFELSQYFERICGASMDKSRSTKEAVIAYLLDHYGGKETMVMVGDTHYDVLGAKSHGIPCIGVSWGYGTVEDMKNAGAIAIADTMEELHDLLKGTQNAE